MPTLYLKTGASYTADGDTIPLGGHIRIGILASGGGVALTYIRIDRISGDHTVNELDQGIYNEQSVMDQDFIFSKDTTSKETWVVFLMNADRQVITRSFVVYKGAGTAFGGILYYPSITLGFQSNSTFPHYLDAHLGQAFTESTVSGHESEIDMLGYYYVTSGNPSPTLTCPGYTAAVGYYPSLTSWPVKNSILYDYYTSDNQLISTSQFDAAANDSLLVYGFRPGSVSGNCKFCYDGRVIPFKTNDSKYGLIKVIRADQSENGSIEIAIKIQE